MFFDWQWTGNIQKHKPGHTDTENVTHIDLFIDVFSWPCEAPSQYTVGKLPELAVLSDFVFCFKAMVLILSFISSAQHKSGSQHRHLRGLRDSGHSKLTWWSAHLVVDYRVCLRSCSSGWISHFNLTPLHFSQFKQVVLNERQFHSNPCQTSSHN